MKLLQENNPFSDSVIEKILTKVWNYPKVKNIWVEGQFISLHMENGSLKYYPVVKDAPFLKDMARNAPSELLRMQNIPARMYHRDVILHTGPQGYDLFQKTVKNELGKYNSAASGQEEPVRTI